ncbi:MAG: hypothetical protein M1118_11690 [Chloroflexi bacterium]|nr:hypothetical protein [Chloroflexota bacterium]
METRYQLDGIYQRLPYLTWVEGPYGLQERLNTQRFAWELDDRKIPADITVLPSQPAVPARPTWSGLNSPVASGATSWLDHLEALAANPGPNKAIVIHLTAQSLTAYDNGRAILTTTVPS